MFDEAKCASMTSSERPLVDWRALEELRAVLDHSEPPKVGEELRPRGAGEGTGRCPGVGTTEAPLPDEDPDDA
jgi:hypothetical protein